MSWNTMRRRSRYLTRWAAAAGAIVAVAAVTTAPTPQASAAPDRPRPPAEPDVAALAGPLASQQLTWGPCLWVKPEDAPTNLRCTSVTVPRDWTNPGNGLTWTLEVSELRNLERSDPAYRGTIFGNPGGPGDNGRVMSLLLQQRAPRLGRTHNFVGFEPRGSGLGSLVICQGQLDPTAPNIALELAQKEAAACAEDPDVRTIDSTQTAYDMDLIRHLLELDRIDYIGYSYGTWLGSIYQRIFPSHADKFLLDSATDVTQNSLQQTFEPQPMARDRQFKLRLTNYVARHDELYGLGTDPRAIFARYAEAVKTIDGDTFGLAWLATGALRAFTDNRFYADMAAATATIIKKAESDKLPKAPAAAAASIARGVALLPDAARATSRSGLLANARELERVEALDEPTGPIPFPFADAFNFIRCNDGPWTQGFDYWVKRREAARTELPVSFELDTVDIPPCAAWRPTATMPPVSREGFPDTMVIQTELDSQTYYEGGRNTATKMPNTHAVLIDNEGSHAIFPYGTACVDEPIYAFFELGAMPRKKVTVCQGKPLPGETKTYETWSRLTPRGAITEPVSSPFVEARTPRPYGPKGFASAPLGGADLGGERSAVARTVLSRYGQ